jgi:hypothetical protein
MPSFDIDTYTVVVDQQAAPSAAGAVRFLTLTSVAEFHDIRHHAQLAFVGGTAPARIGSVTNVDQPNFNGHFVTATLRMSDFADIYDVLRSEKPVRLSYHYAPVGFDPQRPVRDLFRVLVGTGAEPVGEGPAEDLSDSSP